MQQHGTISLTVVLATPIVPPLVCKGNGVGQVSLCVSDYSTLRGTINLNHFPDAQRTDAFAQWGYPRTRDDLTRMFSRYLHSETASTPFSPGPLSPESLTILPHLENLTKRGWWTVGSQPAVDGASSSDEVVGWGPIGGYVYQKGFVEFFADADDVERIERQIVTEGNGWVSFFAGDRQVSGAPLASTMEN